MSGTKIKICGLRRSEDIEYVNEYLPDYIGFIFWPKSHRYLSFEAAKVLKDKLDKRIKAVGVFVDEDIDKVIKAANDDVFDIVQLHGDEDAEYIRRVKEATGKPVIKAIKIKNEEINSVVESDNRKDASTCEKIDNVVIDNNVINEKEKVEDVADYLLIDSGMGSGKTFDWTKKFDFGDKPFFIAGGIDAGNIKEAEDIFKPYGIDLSSSVETDKVKDPEKIRQVIEAIRKND